MTDESGGNFGKYVSMVNRFAQIYYDKALQPYHIGGGQQFFLLVIGKNPDISQWELSEVIAMDKGTTAKAVKKLEDEGYITRIPLKEDKRVKQLRVTDKALPLLAKLEKLREEWDAIVMESMTEEEIEQTEKQMHNIAKRALQYTRQGICKHEEWREF